MKIKTLFVIIGLLFLCMTAGESRANAITTVFQGGVYTMESVRILAGETWESAPGARVIITRADGFPPTVNLEDNSTLRNIWIGGARGGGAFIHPRHNVILDGDTFFGYNEAVNTADAKNVRIINSRFINTGTGLLLHPIYVNNMNALEGEGTTIEDNTFIGGEGYPIHLYHMPRYNSVRRNFVGAGFRCVAVEGDGNIVRDNIFWSNNEVGNFQETCVWLGQGSLSFRHNLLGDGTSDHYLNYGSNAIVRKNTFVGNAIGFGTDQVHIETTDLKPLLGMGNGGINNTVEALELAFTQTPAQLLTDATIEPNFAKLRGVMTRWAE